MEKIIKEEKYIHLTKKAKDIRIILVNFATM